MATLSSESLVARIAALQDYKLYEDLHWEGSFEDYLRIVRERPQVTRNAFQRVYDMIISYGTRSTSTTRRSSSATTSSRTRSTAASDAIFGLDIPLMRLVHVLKAAAAGLRPREARHPAARPGRLVEVTIARLLKKGIEDYSRTPDGALYTFDWVNLAGHRRVAGDDEPSAFPCPMHEEPLRLIPADWRDKAIDELAPRQRPVPRPASTAISIRPAASSSSA